MEGNIFDCLPDSVLLKVIEHLDFGDRQALLQVGPRFRRLCYDMELVRCSNFEGCYTLAEDDLKQHVQYSWRYIRVLNLNHCYWLNQKCLHVAIKKCRNLQQLHIIQCNLSTTLLVSLLTDLSELRSLSFSTDSFLNIKKETFHPARETLKNLISVCIYYSSRELAVMNYLGEQSTLLDFCENLEELVINSAEISIPELCRPVFSKPKKLETIKSMSLSSNIHAAANLLFYSTLAVLAHLQIPLEKLLMPNVNFAEFSQKPEYKDCLKNVSEIKYLDISGSFQPVDGTILNITTARQLRYYNVSRTKVTSQHLADVASSCRNLTSLNIFECSHAFFEGPKLNVVGLSELLKKCCQLRHLNIGGIHCHVEDSKSSNQIRKIICEIKGQWGMPTVSMSAVCAMLSGIIATTVESVGDYHACAKLAGSPPPPLHAVNRGILIEGIGTFFDGLMGTGNGTTSTSINVGVVGITKVGSRRVIQVSAVFMVAFGIFTKFGALFITIPDPIIGGAFFILFGMIVAVGISSLQHVDMNSGRNLFIIGFSIFTGLALPQWMMANPTAIQTGNQTVDSVCTVLLSTGMFVGGIIGFILDNTIRGTIEERGLLYWKKMRATVDRPNASQYLKERISATYDLPYVGKILQKARFLRHVPFCQTYTSSRKTNFFSWSKSKCKCFSFNRNTTKENGLNVSTP